MNLRRIAGTLACAAAVLARGALATPPDAGVVPEAWVRSCDTRRWNSVCLELPAVVSLQTRRGFAARCRGIPGEASALVCPRAGRIGSCHFGSGEIARHYATGGSPQPLAEARRECTHTREGRWTNE